MSKRKVEDMQEQTVEAKDEDLTQAFISKLKFSKPLDGLNKLERVQCEKCRKTRRYYCYTCMISMKNDNSIPKLQLPMKVVILQHPKELKSKSTAIHAKVLAPDSVQIFEYPDIPDFINPINSILLYPGKNAITVPELVKKNMETSNKIEFVVFIDSTWQQSKKIFRDDRVSALPCVKIADQKTLFWRYQEHGDSFLATIEAIYFFFCEFSVDGRYNGQYDDLLYFYAHQYELIQNRYRNDPSLKFQHKDNYIHYDENSTNKKSKK